MNEVKGEIPSITNLATTAALTAMENKIPDVSDLVKKKTRLLHKNIRNSKKKHFTTSDYIKFTKNILDPKTKKKIVHESGLDKKIKTLARKEKRKASTTQAKSKTKEDEIVKI